MKAVCLKKLRRYEESQSTYKELHEIIRRTENQEIVKYVFGIILLPFNNERRLVTDYIENFENMMDFYGTVPKIQDPLMNYYVPNDGWITDKVPIVLDKLKNRSFFRRFNKI